MRREYWRHNWKASAVTTLILLTFVESIIMLVYPVDAWLWELSLSGLLTVTLTFPLMVHFTGQLRENRLLTQELERLVNRDRLTDLATRDRFYELIDAEPDPIGVVLMIDLDNFKRINDTYGHLTGDKVIREISRLLQDQCRQDDIVCRFGGEEILIYLSKMNIVAARQFSEMLRASVEAFPIRWDKGVVEVTISIGAAHKHRFDHIDRAIANADTALYDAKRGGRNRVSLFWELPDSALETAS